MGVGNVLLFVFAVTGALTAQIQPEVAAKADAYINAAAIQGSVLLATNGMVVLAKGYGLANIELDVPNSPETKFRLGSITGSSEKSVGEWRLGQLAKCMI